jgi:hypothetical protein
VCSKNGCAKSYSYIIEVRRMVWRVERERIEIERMEIQSGGRRK